MPLSAVPLPLGGLGLLAHLDSAARPVAGSLQSAGAALAAAAVLLVLAGAASRAQRSVRLAAWGILAVASLGVFLGGAELMVVAIALPSIVADFGGWADLGRASWIVNAYLLAYIVAMPLAGRAADLWGARRLYLVALALFCLGSLGAGLSRVAGPESRPRLADRVAGGAGASAAERWSRSRWRWPATSSPGRSRAAALGIEGAATFVGMAVGPAYGAWVLLNVALPIPGLDVVGWQWIFFLNVPVGLLVLLLLYVVAGGVETPRAPGPPGPGRRGCSPRWRWLRGSERSRSPASAAGPTRWSWAGWPHRRVSIAAFVLRELRQATPLIDPRLFADARFAASNGVSLLTGYTLATAIIGGPVFVNRVLNAGADRSAAALTALTLAIAIGAVVGGVGSGLVGQRLTAVAGVGADRHRPLVRHRLGGRDRPARGCSATWPSSGPASG